MPLTTARMLVRTKGGTWVSPERSGFDSEAELQRMLAARLGLLPDVSDSAVAVEEFATGVGPTDVVVVDHDGSVTLVECKLATNAEVRRKVVGQVLDYAARLWRTSLEDFDARWQARTGQSVLEGLDDDARDRLRTNLSEGQFTLVLAVDRINEDLQRIVEFLNVHTGDTVRVLAMELDRAAHGDVELLIPTVFGAEIAEAAAAREGVSGRWSKPRWTVDDVVRASAEPSPELGVVVRDFVERLPGSGLTVEGTRAARPSCVVGGRVGDARVWPFAIYAGDDGRHTLAVNYDWLRGVTPDARDRFLVETAAVLPSIDADAVRAADFRKRPGVPLVEITVPGVVDRLVAAAGSLGAEPLT